MPRPRHPQRDTVVQWMKDNQKTWTQAAKQFGLPSRTVKFWWSEEKKKLDAKSAPAAAAGGPVAVSRTEMEKIQGVIDARLDALLDPERIKGESTGVIVDAIVKLRTSFRLDTEQAAGPDQGLEELQNVLTLVQSTP